MKWEHPDAKDVLLGLAWLWDIIKVGIDWFRLIVFLSEPTKKMEVN